MADGKIIALFGRDIQATAQSPTDRDLFGSVPEARGKVVFLDEADWQEESLLRLMARNPVGAVIDLRSRPVFRLPRYRHRRVVSYFFKHDIQYLELINVLRQNSAGEDKIPIELAGIVFNRTERGLTIFLYDTDSRERGWLDSMRGLMTCGTNRFVELHPRSLGGSVAADRRSR